MPEEYTRDQIDAAITQNDDDIRQANRIISLRTQLIHANQTRNAKHHELLEATRNEFDAFNEWMNGSGNSKAWTKSKASLLRLTLEYGAHMDRCDSTQHCLDLEVLEFVEGRMAELKCRSAYLNRLVANVVEIDVPRRDFADVVAAMSAPADTEGA